MESDQEIYELLTGEKGIKKEKMNSFLLRVADVIKIPKNLPFLVEDLYNTFEEHSEGKKKELRYAFLRLQIDSDLRQHEDMQTMGERKYVAQVLEKLFYGDLLLENRPKKEKVN